MPRMEGLELLSRLREKSQLPVIFLTSKDDEIDEALGLAMGADDYIAKPFSQRLVIARIRAILRRVELNRNAPSEDDEPVAEPIPRGRRSEEHTSELQSLMRISYAVFCLQKKTHTTTPIQSPTHTTYYTYAMYTH